jgi:hypothetical protein
VAVILGYVVAAGKKFVLRWIFGTGLLKASWFSFFESRAGLHCGNWALGKGGRIFRGADKTLAERKPRSRIKTKYLAKLKEDMLQIKER